MKTIFTTLFILLMFTQLSGQKMRFQLHEIGEFRERMGQTSLVDMDHDGGPDIVTAEADTKDGRVFWFENRENAGTFVYHPISANSTMQDFHSLALADFDGDGDVDVSSGGGPLSEEIHRLYIWENISGDASHWKEHLILEGKRIHEAVAGDVDRDGDVDICTKPWNGGLHIYLENKLIE